ncbi:MAG: CRISPR-associated protein Cas4 [Methylococcaceae bacterium]|jgi:CRISPR-associated exonuclease Cas4
MKSSSLTNAGTLARSSRPDINTDWFAQAGTPYNKPAPALSYLADRNPTPPPPGLNYAVHGNNLSASETGSGIRCRPSQALPTTHHFTSHGSKAHAGSQATAYPQQKGAKTATLIPIAALQHFLYCPRLCGLAYQAEANPENIMNRAESRPLMRSRIAGANREQALEIQTDIPLISERLGLIGTADEVELKTDGTIRPIQYLHGLRRNHEQDEIAIAAQMLCLEEMTGKTITEALLVHSTSRHRKAMSLTTELRSKVGMVTTQTRHLLQSGDLASPLADPAKCRTCSLLTHCQPEIFRARQLIERIAATL